eukprot:Gb_21242 [translate_table: standard]
MISATLLQPQPLILSALNADDRAFVMCILQYLNEVWRPPRLFAAISKFPKLRKLLNEVWPCCLNPPLGHLTSVYYLKLYILYKCLEGARNFSMAPVEKTGQVKLVGKRKDKEVNIISGSPSVKKSKDNSVEIFKSEAEAVKEVQQGRVRILKAGLEGKNGPVIYWMSRDQRSRDNWALIYAVEKAVKMETSVAVAFNLVDDFLEAKARHFGFMLRGLRVVEYNLKALEIPFFLFQGTAEENIPNFLERCGASLLVMDFSPLLIGRIWRENICNKVGEGTAIHEVDAHNIVPVWRASDKLEYSARTIRTKIQKQLPEYLVQFPDFKTPDQKWIFEKPAVIDWDSLIDSVLSFWDDLRHCWEFEFMTKGLFHRKGAEVPEIRWCEPGEDAAKEVLLGKKNGFLTTKLKNYADDRNDPSKPTGLSGLSPYLHYGQISSQRCALEARAFRKIHPKVTISG